MRGLFLIVLLLAAVQDLRSRSIGKVFLVLSGLCGLICRDCGDGGLMNLALSMAVGALVLFFSRLTGGQIGEGDGWFFLVTGCFLRAEENVLLLLSGLLFCGVFSLGAAVVAIVGNRSFCGLRFPFLPFLLPGGFLIAL